MTALPLDEEKKYVAENQNLKYTKFINFAFKNKWKLNENKSMSQ